jgi:RNA polymerase sigma-70 factor (ECF subfamily)
MTDWSELVKQHGPVVWKTASRLLSNEADAADCFQNAFIAALDVSRRQAVRSWPGLLKQLATVAALQQLRRRYAEAARRDGRASTDDVLSKAAGPGERTEAVELQDKLRKAISTLDEKQAEVFCLACFEGLEYREIADHLSISVNYVGVLLNRAKASLREELKSFAPESYQQARQDRSHG